MFIDDFSPYFFEGLSANEGEGIDGGKESASAVFLQLTAACNAKCLFCSERNNPWQERKPKARSVEEIEHMLFSFEGKAFEDIELSRTHPGRINEGEPLTHPHFLDVLRRVRRRFPDKRLVIDTNGAFMTQSLLRQLEPLGPMLIRLSLPTTDRALWTATFQTLNGEHYTNAMGLLERAGSLAGIEVRPNMVAMPSWYGYSAIRKTVKHVSEAGLGSFTVYSPGYTRYTPAEIVAKMRFDKATLAAFTDEMAEEFGLEVEWGLDPRLPLEMPPLRDLFKSLATQGEKRIVVLTSTMAFERAKRNIADSAVGIPATVETIAVPNKVYGGNIGSAGLWLLSDVAETLECVRGATVVLPKKFLDCYGFDLLGNSFITFERENPNRFVRL